MRGLTGFDVIHRVPLALLLLLRLLLLRLLPVRLRLLCFFKGKIPVTVIV